MPRAAACLFPILLTLAASPDARAQERRGRDLDALAARATVAVRGEIVGVGPDGADLHPLTVYARRGGGPPVPVVRVRSEGDGNPMRPAPGDRGIYFLAPSSEMPGALAFVQDDTERLPVEADADAAVDAFMRRFLEARQPPARLWLEGLSTGSPALARQSARKLAALARTGALASADWDRLLGCLSGEAASDDLQATVVAELGPALPSDRALSLLSRAREGSRLKSALLAAAGERGGEKAGTGVTRQEVRDAIGAAAAGDASPEVALAAAEGLAALGDEAAIGLLDRALGAGDPAARQRAAEAMARLALGGSRKARFRLQALFDDPDGLVRARARNAWADAYLNDPARLQRTRPSIFLVAAAVVLLMAVGIHAWIDRRRRT